MKLSVIGVGYVGLVSAACFAEIGHQVVAVDNDPHKIDMLRNGQIPIHEEGLLELVARHSGDRLRFSTDIQEASTDADAVFICVGTPPAPNGQADLSYVERVARELALLLNGHKVIVEKSTVPVGTCEAVKRTMLLYGASPRDISVASNPEFLREGTAVQDFLYPDRILIGVPDEQSLKTLSAIYQPILDGSYYKGAHVVPGKATQQPQLLVTSVKSAELIKHASNAFLALKISFINAVATVCERVGADVREVAVGVGTDSRIGPKFLSPGVGYGGSCFPKDVMAFRSVAQSVGYDFSLLSEVIAINDSMKERFIEKVRGALWTLRGKRLAVLGLAFKGGTDDCRESPAIDLILRLKAEGADITAYDPAAMDRASEILPQGTVTFAEDEYAACVGADALLLLTEWPQFATLDWQKVQGLLQLPIVLDGKNLLDPTSIRSAGMHYYGVGCCPEPLDAAIRSQHPAWVAPTEAASSTTAHSA